MILHVHKGMTDMLNIEEVVDEFIQRKESRRAVFGPGWFECVVWVLYFWIMFWIYFINNFNTVKADFNLFWLMITWIWICTN